MRAQPIFTELDDRLSIVPRWVILRTIQKQSVAEHCFNVARMAEKIAMQWYNIDPLTDDGGFMMYSIVGHALHHDDEEAVTGDAPSITKSQSDKHWTLAMQIVKIADKLEGFRFLCLEKAMGNNYVAAHIAAEYDIVSRKLRSIGVDEHIISKTLGVMYEWERNLRSREYSLADFVESTASSLANGDVPQGIRVLHGAGSGEEPDDAGKLRAPRPGAPRDPSSGRWTE